LEALPKKRYEHIHVRLASAIHGRRHFWEGLPTGNFWLERDIDNIKA
jgi:hypothetical protein